MSSIKETLLNALEMKYKAQMSEAKANIAVYLNNPAGIGEHSEILQAIDEQMHKYSEAKENLEVLLKDFI